MSSLLLGKWVTQSSRRCTQLAQGPFKEIKLACTLPHFTKNRAVLILKTRSKNCNSGGANSGRTLAVFLPRRIIYNTTQRFSCPPPPLPPQYSFVSCEKFGSPYLGMAQQPQEQRYPFLSECTVFSCVQTMVWLPAFGIFNVRTDVDACDCTRGLYRHQKSLH